MDVFTSEKRSQVMRAVKSRDTGAEMTVRKTLHGAGFRYRLHHKDLAGKPDIVFAGRHKIIFVHGCFWHQHLGCRYADRPSSHTEYWQSKLNRNMERDSRNITMLRDQGWDVLVVWECQTKNYLKLHTMLNDFLQG